MPTKKNIAVIGAGFSGLASATLLAHHGYEVHIYEKNGQSGGRARVLQEQGYLFDMGPSWYWMPDVFDRYFDLFGKKVSDYYNLQLLSPGFRVYFGKDDYIDIPDSLDKLCYIFETLEKGAADKLRKFMKQAKMKYQIGMQDLVYQPAKSITEFVDIKLFKQLLQLKVFRNLHKEVAQYFSHPHIQALLEFPVLFLGATANEIPSLYSLMDYAAYQLGTWYPMGGFSKISEALEKLALEKGVHIHTLEAATGITIHNNKATKLVTPSGSHACDAIIGAADYHHTETLLEEKYRNYPESYWDKKTFAPSSLIFYIGLNKKVPALLHHNLFFDESLNHHAHEIYKSPKWPTQPLFYVSCTSKTDPSVAPGGHENLFILIPIAVDLKDDEATREKYYHIVMDRILKITGEDLRPHVDYKKSYCVSDFKNDYHSYKGNAYGLANTLTQTAFMRPKIYNKKVNNIYYTGQLTVPGPGIPPALISGEIVANELMKKI